MHILPPRFTFSAFMPAKIKKSFLKNLVLFFSKNNLFNCQIRLISQISNFLSQQVLFPFRNTYREENIIFREMAQRFVLKYDFGSI